MCFSTVYVRSADGPREIMKDVARVDAEGQGFWLINLFGERQFVAGRIHSIDLADGHSVLIDPSPAECF